MPGPDPLRGLSGRLPPGSLHELLAGTDAVKALVQRKAGVEEIRKQAVADGMRTLYQDGIAKVFEGRSDRKMVRAVCIR